MYVDVVLHVSFERERYGKKMHVSLQLVSRSNIIFVALYQCLYCFWQTGYFIFDPVCIV
jgi:hypothetical protein